VGGGLNSVTMSMGEKGADLLLMLCRSDPFKKATMGAGSGSGHWGGFKPMSNSISPCMKMPVDQEKKSRDPQQSALQITVF
jgi:hypothetical protein